MVINVIIKTIKVKSKKKNIDSSLVLTITLPILLIFIFYASAILCIGLTFYFLYKYRYGEEGISLVILCFSLIIFFGILAQSCQRWKIVIKTEHIEITPMIGRKKQITFNLIEKAVKKPFGTIGIFSEKKKLANIDPYSVGYEEFCKLLEDKGIKIEVLG